jgi:hypothetical protein
MIKGRLLDIDNIVFETTNELSDFLEGIFTESGARYLVTGYTVNKDIVFYLNDYNESIYLLKTFGIMFNYLSRHMLKNALRWKYPARVVAQKTTGGKFVISSYHKYQTSPFYDNQHTLYLCFGFPVESQFYVEL